MSDYSGPVCRGSWALGTACGKCERCLETKPPMTTRKLHDAAMAAQLLAIKEAADAILAPVCASNGRYLYDHADCPNMIENLHGDGVVISAKAFRDLYDATDYDVAQIKQALAALEQE